MVNVILRKKMVIDADLSIKLPHYADQGQLVSDKNACTHIQRGEPVIALF